MLTVVWFGFWLAVAIALILRLQIFRASAFRTRTLIGLFLLKLAAGAALIWVYSTIYPNRQTADIFKFFDDAVVINEALTENPGAHFRIMSGIGDTSAACLPYLERTQNWAPQSEQWLEYAQTGNYNYFLSNRLITRIHVLLWPLSGGGIYTHLIFFNFLSLLGIVFFSECLSRSKRTSCTGIYALALYPTLVFRFIERQYRIYSTLLPVWSLAACEGG